MKDRVRRLTEEDIEAWRAHPVTEAVFGYMKDVAHAERMAWFAGNGWTEQSKMYVEIMEAVPTLSLDEMKTFYEEESNDAGEDDDPGSG